MIVVEDIKLNGKLFKRSYSDEGFMIERDGILYSEAIDPADHPRRYIETDIKMPVSEEE